MSEKKENQLEKAANQESQSPAVSLSCRGDDLAFELARMHREAAILYRHRYAPRLLRYDYTPR